MKHDHVVARGHVSYTHAQDVGWSIDLAGLKEDLSAAGTSRRNITSGNADQRYSLTSDSFLNELSLPNRPLIVTTDGNEPLRIGDVESDRKASFLIADTGAISARFYFPLKDQNLETIAGLVHELDYDQQKIAANYGKKLVQGLVDRIQGHIDTPSVSGEVQNYRIVKLQELQGEQAALNLLKEAPAELAQILKGEVRKLSQEQIDDALAIASSYYEGERSIIDTRNAVLLGNANFRDVSTILGFAVVELLEMRVLEQMLERYLETEDLAGGVQAAYSDTSRRKSRFRLSELDHIHQQVAVQLGRANNPLKLNDDHHYADLRELAAKRLGLDRWTRQVQDHLTTIREIGTDLSDHRKHRAALLVEVGVFLLICYEVFAGIYHK